MQDKNSYVFAADTDQEQDGWVTTLKKVCVKFKHLLLYGLLRLKRFV